MDQKQLRIQWQLVKPQISSGSVIDDDAEPMHVLLVDNDEDDFVITENGYEVFTRYPFWDEKLLG